MNEAGQVYFTDVLNGGAYRWSPDGTVTTLIPRRRGVGGLVLHQDGGIVMSGRTIIHHTDVAERTLLLLEDVPGFNDLLTDRAGRIYAGNLRSSALEMEARIPGERYGALNWI